MLREDEHASAMFDDSDAVRYAERIAELETELEQRNITIFMLRSTVEMLRTLLKSANTIIEVLSYMLKRAEQERGNEQGHQ